MAHLNVDMHLLLESSLSTETRDGESSLHCRPAGHQIMYRTCTVGDAPLGVRVSIRVKEHGLWKHYMTHGYWQIPLHKDW